MKTGKHGQQFEQLHMCFPQGKHYTLVNNMFYAIKTIHFKPVLPENIAQLVISLFNMHRALGSIPRTT